MNSPRARIAISRIDTAIERIKNALSNSSEQSEADEAHAAEMLKLLAKNEKLKKEIVETINDLDQVISELEE